MIYENFSYVITLFLHVMNVTDNMKINVRFHKAEMFVVVLDMQLQK